MRYSVKPKLWYGVNEPTSWDYPPRSIEIYETECTPQPTGLLDKSGEKLFRVRVKEPIGFVRPK